MILAIDAGNTDLVLGAFGSTSAVILHQWRIPTHPIGSAEQLRARISQALALDRMSPADFEDVVLSSVSPELTLRLCEAFPKTLVIDHRWPFSFRIATERPDKTGVDRLVNAEAVVRQRKTSAIIVDAGTATTIDALIFEENPTDPDLKPTFLGGAILPGMQILRDSLSSRTAQLPAVELKPPAKAIGTNTDEALRSGIILGYASMLDGMVRRIRSELHSHLGLPASRLEPPRVVATGGIASLLYGISDELPTPDLGLTLKGIAYLYESFRNRQY